MNLTKRYHCCATCTHFRASKENHKVITHCSRLGYNTKPNYQFHCWNPNERIKAMIKHEIGQN